MKLLSSSIKKFRPTPVSIVLLVLATIRMFLTGNSITVVGICASVVPFICQFKRYPNKDEAITENSKVLVNYFMNLLFMAAYLCFMTGVTRLGSIVLTSYTENQFYKEMVLLSICANLIFIGSVYTIGHKLSPKQLLMEGILLCNAQLGFMYLAADYVRQVQPANLVIYLVGFSILIFLLTMGFIKMNYGTKNRSSKLGESQSGK